MKTSAHCPSCNATISLGRVLRAPTPLHLSCGSCGAHLRVRGAVLPMIVVAAVVVGLFASALFRMYGVRAALLPVLAAVLVVEVVACLLVLNRGKLELRR
jgi:uncharacterized protein (DUF983 family)